MFPLIAFLIVMSFSDKIQASDSEKESKTYTCPGRAVSSSCINAVCHIQCSSGEKRTHSCGEGSSSISSRSNPDGSTAITVSCGEKLPDCFPFCGGIGGGSGLPFFSFNPKPIVITQRPTPKPVVITQRPTPKPIVITQRPTPKPIVITQRPTPKPIVITQRPTPKPVVITQRPTPKPIVITQRPTPKPIVITQRPIQQFTARPIYTYTTRKPYAPLSFNYYNPFAYFPSIFQPCFPFCGVYFG